jgi:hypothetical protein
MLSDKRTEATHTRVSKSATKAETKQLVKEYLKKLEGGDWSDILFYEREITKRIGSGNSVVIDGRVITVINQKIEGQEYPLVLVTNRRKLDDGKKKGKVKTPFDHLESDDLMVNPNGKNDIITVKEFEKESKVPTAKRKCKGKKKDKKKKK